jgi:hypothetical protein
MNVKLYHTQLSIMQLEENGPQNVVPLKKTNPQSSAVQSEA